MKVHSEFVAGVSRYNAKHLNISNYRNTNLHGCASRKQPTTNDMAKCFQHEPTFVAC